MLYGYGFIFWPIKLNFENLEAFLNNMHTSMKFTIGKTGFFHDKEKKL